MDCDLFSVTSTMEKVEFARPESPAMSGNRTLNKGRQDRRSSELLPHQAVFSITHCNSDSAWSIHELFTEKQLTDSHGRIWLSARLSEDSQGADF